MAMNNSLAEVHPELVSEWSEKNLTLTPDDITFGSDKKVWWRGACGHEWQASVKARSNGEKCPICSGARVIAGINDLATLGPLLINQCIFYEQFLHCNVSVCALFKYGSIRGMFCLIFRHHIGFLHSLRGNCCLIYGLDCTFACISCFYISHRFLPFSKKITALRLIS